MLRATLVLVLLVVGLPLLGVRLAGRPLAPFLEFPPLTEHVAHAPFSWPVFIGLAAVVALITAPVLIRVVAVPVPRERSHVRGRWPWWGWFGLMLVAACWPLAWTRLPWFAPWQPFTFTPLWLGYILIVNAMTYRRTRRCMLLDRPFFFLVLFPASALFWWGFEYLNRFVQNWYYAGIVAPTSGEYVFHATISFSTVLPAVLGTTEWLQTSPRLRAAFCGMPAIRVVHPERLGWTILLLASAGLAGIGVWPDYLFPLLWVSPLLIITAVQLIAGRPTVFDSIGEGDWRAIWIPALAGLQCGVFWEMWNVYSLAHWRYAIPYVHRFLIFEMPVLGYAGYLPFGLECYVVGDVIARLLAKRPSLVHQDKPLSVRQSGRIHRLKR